MLQKRIIWTALVALTACAAAMTPRTVVHAQGAPTPRADVGDAAIAALVAEVRGLRADLAAASRNQLRAQVLLGRVQMQEQRLAYLDKQRADTVAQIGVLSQLTSAFQNQFQSFDPRECSKIPAQDRRDCDAQAGRLKQQLSDQEQREQQLRAQENDLTNALSAEQARWSQFNSQLDELERALR